MLTGYVLTRIVTNEISTFVLWQWSEPHLLRHRITTMAGIASHAGITNVLLPVTVDMTCHLNHLARNNFGVLRIVREILQVVALVLASKIIVLSGQPGSIDIGGASFPCYDLSIKVQAQTA